jgi:hypothetical protein
MSCSCWARDLSPSTWSYPLYSVDIGAGLGCVDNAGVPMVVVFAGGSGGQTGRVSHRSSSLPVPEPELRRAETGGSEGFVVGSLCQ